jgi:hypothetical protein
MAPSMSFLGVPTSLLAPGRFAVSFCMMRDGLFALVCARENSVGLDGFVALIGGSAITAI